MRVQKANHSVILLGLSIGTFCWSVQQPASAAISLGNAASFAVLAGSTVTNTGPTTIAGDVGVSPGTAITDLLPEMVSNGTLHSNDIAASLAKADAQSAYNLMLGMAITQELSGTNLGGLTLTPGVYLFTSSAQLTGILTLDGLGQLDPVFVFKVGSTLTTATDSSVVLTRGASGTENVFFQVGASSTLGVRSAFAGTIIASQNNTLNTSATLDGRVISLTGAVTLDSNTITAVPEPVTGALLLPALAGLFVRKRGTATTLAIG